MSEQVDVTLTAESLVEESVAKPVEEQFQQHDEAHEENIFDADIDFEQLFKQQQNPEDYLKMVVDNFSEEQLQSFLEAAAGYKELYNEYSTKVYNAFSQNNFQEDLTLDTTDARYTKIWNEVLPILPVLVDAGKVNETLLTEIDVINKQLGEVSMFAESFNLLDDNEEKQYVATLDRQIFAATLHMVNFQFVNVLRTLHKARNEGNLTNELITDMENVLSVIVNQTKAYLDYVGVDASLIVEISESVSSHIERYKTLLA